MIAASLFLAMTIGIASFSQTLNPQPSTLDPRPDAYTLPTAFVNPLCVPLRLCAFARDPEVDPKSTSAPRPTTSPLLLPGLLAKPQSRQESQRNFKSDSQSSPTHHSHPLTPSPFSRTSQTSQTSPTSPFLSGGDVSEIPEVEAGGASYFLNGKKEDPFAIMKKAGWNWVRFRIWNAPKDGYCDKAKTLALAKRAAAQGLKISLDFHYSDWWADPGKQTKPAGWKDLSFAELNKAVYNYTYEVVAAMIEQGTPPVMVQVGNEIIGGMLWPEGRVRSNEEETWQRFATLLKSGLKAVRDAEKLLRSTDSAPSTPNTQHLTPNTDNPSPATQHLTPNTDNPSPATQHLTPRTHPPTPNTQHLTPRTQPPTPDTLSPHPRILTLLHIDRGGDNAASVWWMDHIVKQGVEFDALGQSFYPWWHGTLEDLQTNLNDLAKRYGKDIYVVETAYPWTMDHKRRSLFNDREKLLPGYPATPDGQAAFLRKVTEIIKAVPGGHGKGLLYWAPTWITGPKYTAPYPYENLATFDPEGKALPAVKALGAGKLAEKIKA